MRVAVAGAGSAVGRCAVPALEASSHEVVPFGRAVRDLLDTDAMAQVMQGCDAVINLAAQIPLGPAARWRRNWRTHALLRSEGTVRLVEAARAAGVRRIVHQSFSLVYADQGDEWINETSPVCVTAATEPSSMAEAAVQDFTSSSRTGVVMRMGIVLGDSTMTRWSLRAAAQGRPVGVGAPDGYVHVIHSDDVGPAVDAALEAPSGVYNVGALPVQRADLVDGYARAVGHDRGQYVGPLMARLGGMRVEPLARSLRVSSSRFVSSTGWEPRHEQFDLSWFEAAGMAKVAVR